MTLLSVIGMISSPHSTTIYLLLTEFEVRTKRTEFFSPLFDLWLKHKARKAITGKNEDP